MCFIHAIILFVWSEEFVKGRGDSDWQLIIILVQNLR